MRIPTLCAALALTAAACASGPPKDARVIDLANLDQVVLDDKGPFVIRIPEGTRLPVNVVIDAPFAHSEGGEPAFHAVFDRTVFWYPRRAHEISFDGETWHDFDDGHRGNLSIGFGKSEAEGVLGSVSLRLQPDD